MQLNADAGATRRSRIQRWLPAVLVLGMIGAVVTGTVLGVRTLTSGPSEISSTPEAAPRPSAQAPTREPTTAKPVGPVYSSSGAEMEHPTGVILETVDGRYQMDISTYNDRQIAQFMVHHAAYHAGLDLVPQPQPMRDGANRWLHEIVTTAVEDGGPDLKKRNQFERILDRWDDGDYSRARSEWDQLLRISG